MNLTELRGLVDAALEGLSAGTAARGGPVAAGSPAELALRVGEVLGNPLPRAGRGAARAVRELAELSAFGAADPADPRCAAHLHCPPLPVAVVADLVASVLNQSLDSWDQGPAATLLETRVIAALAGLVGFDPNRAAGSVTSGGTESNLMGLLLARDRAGGEAGGRRGLRILCSELAHFSVQRSAVLLGLGESAVTPVPVDGSYRMDAGALDQLVGEGPTAIVATAGTTDFGSVDPLRDIASVAGRRGAWLHVDAAYGGGALFSDRLRPLLDGLSAADSIALDLHKLGWQPVPAGVFLAREAATLDVLARRVAYLNPVDDEKAGYVSLLGRSLRTTRRPDVLKVAVTLRALGTAGLGELVDRCHDLARHAAAAVDARPQLELAVAPTLTTVVFRYAARTDPDRVNAALRRRLLREGRAVVGRAEVGPERAVHLKLTLLNPASSPAAVDALLDDVVAAGAAEDQ